MSYEYLEQGNVIPVRLSKAVARVDDAIVELNPEEKQEIIEKAMGEFIKINKKSLLRDVLKRPGFYWSLAHDMAFFKHPKFFVNYLKDYSIE